MVFFSSLYKSLYDIKWLKSNKNNRRGAWKYFFSLVGAITVVSVLTIGVSFFSGIKTSKESWLGAIPEFEAQFKSGELIITGLPQPFIRRQEDTSKDRPFVFIVDTISTSTVSLNNILLSGESGALITREKMEFFDAREGRGRTQSWKNVPDAVFNRSKAVSLVERFSSTPFLLLLLALIGALLFVGLVVGKLMSLFIVTLLAFIVARLTKHAWRWSELFSVGLFAITLPSILSFFLPYFSIGAGYVPFLVLLAFMLALVLTRDEISVAEKNQNPPPPQT